MRSFSQTGSSVQNSDYRNIKIGVTTVIVTTIINFFGYLSEPFFGSSIRAHPDFFVSTFWAPLGISLHVLTICFIFSTVYFYFRLKELRHEIESLKTIYGVDSE